MEAKCIGFLSCAGHSSDRMKHARPTVAVAALCVLAIASVAVAYSFLPGAPQSATQGDQIVTAVVSTSGGSSIFTQGPGTAVSAPACSGSTESYGNMTWTVSPCVSYGFPSATMKNATLDSRQVLPFIKTAYDYHLLYFAFSKTDSSVMYAVLNVTGSQVVTGNWTGGYKVSYVGDELLNVTVLQVVVSHYEVTHVSTYSLPDRNESVVYTPQQVQAIQIALSNTTVKSLLVAPPYYVEFVDSSDNATFADANFVQFYQIDGTGVVGAFVNPTITSVVGTYTEQRISAECWPDGLVITDPWAATGFTGCKA
jgi:hypothetical protein